MARSEGTSPVSVISHHLQQVLHSREDDTQAALRDVAAQRERYLIQHAIYEALTHVNMCREISNPEAMSGDGHATSDGSRQYGGQPYSVDSYGDVGTSLSDPASAQALAMEVAERLMARSRAWKERQAASHAGASMPPPSAASAGRLAAEAEALSAALRAVDTCLAAHRRMQEALEHGVLEQQEQLDKVDTEHALTNARALVLKLQTLELQVLHHTYSRPLDLAALRRVREELGYRADKLRAEVKEAQNSLSAYRALGPDFHSQLRAYRDVQRQLNNAQYTLSQYHSMEQELRQQQEHYQQHGHDGGMDVW